MGDITTTTAYTNLVNLTASGSVASGNLKPVGALEVAPSEATTTSGLTSLLEAFQGEINTARVAAGSQYAALESAINYTTDLTAQYELGFNVVNDVNFSMETAHLARNQILQQAATAMLAQANQGQQGLLQLIQG
jgi:flagellin